MEHWEKLEQVIKCIDLSDKSLADIFGIINVTKICNIINNKTDVPEEITQLIIEKYPQINEQWLRHTYNLGGMLNNTNMNNRDKTYKLRVNTHSAFLRTGHGERLKKIIKWTGLTSHQFALGLGFKRAENIYRILRNLNKISDNVRKLIKDKYPEINEKWLIYGEGELLIADETEIIMNGDMIPCYSNTALSPLYAKTNNPDFYIYNPTLRSSDFAITMENRELEPTIPKGYMVILKKQRIADIIFGNIYCIMTDNISMIRIANNSEVADDEINFVATNKKKFADILMPKSLIKEVYLVCGITYNFTTKK